MTAANVYPIQLVLLNCLVPFVWFILCQSTTSAGLTTGTQIISFEWRNSHNTSLQNSVLTRDAIARYEYGSREFNSIFFQNNYAYLTCFVPRPMELIQHLANTGFQYLENSFLNITAASLIREVSWVACIFKQATSLSCRAIHSSYGKDYGSVKEFVDYMNSLPEYGFIYVDTGKSGPEKYKKMKAPAKIARFCYKNTI